VRTAESSELLHAFSVDLEDGYSLYLGQMGEPHPPTRSVVALTERILAFLDEKNVKTTFFALGEIAAAFPELIRRIARAGHELGVHGYDHRKAFELSPEQMREQISRTRKMLEDLTGDEIRGFRAPAFSIRPDTTWVLELLAEEGFAYDSSIFPCRGRRYGWPGFPSVPVRITLAGGRSILEVPMPTFQWLGRSWPLAGGGYLRHFPWWYTRFAANRCIRNRQPIVVYFHPYDIDADGETAPTAFRTRRKTLSLGRTCYLWTQEHNRASVLTKLAKLLELGRFGTVKHLLASRLNCIENVDLSPLCNCGG